MSENLPNDFCHRSDDGCAAMVNNSLCLRGVAYPLSHMALSLSLSLFPINLFFSLAHRKDEMVDDNHHQQQQ